MRGQKTNLWISKKDKKLFDYLHAVKVATIQQINRDVYQNHKIKATYARVRAFEQSGYLSPTGDTAFPRVKLVNLTSTGFRHFVSTGDEQLVELKSDSVYHDVTLVDIRHELLSTSKVKNYYTENMLQTWPAFYNDERIRPFVDIRCDGAIEAEFQLGRVNLAVEFEASLKSQARVSDVIHRYYSDPAIPAVLYICENEAIKSHFTTLESQFFSSQEPKIYYLCLQNMFVGSALTFSNREGECLQFPKRFGINSRL